MIISTNCSKYGKKLITDCASYKIHGNVSPAEENHFLMDWTAQRLQDRSFLSKKIGSTQREIAKTEDKSVKADTTDHISHKLGRYEIIEKNMGQLFWKSPSGLGSLKVGRCHIKGSILFLEPGKTELSSLLKKRIYPTVDLPARLAKNQIFLYELHHLLFQNWWYLQKVRR